MSALFAVASASKIVAKNILPNRSDTEFSRSCFGYRTPADGNKDGSKGNDQRESASWANHSGLEDKVGVRPVWDLVVDRGCESAPWSPWSYGQARQRQAGKQTDSHCSLQWWWHCTPPSATTSHHYHRHHWLAHRLRDLGTLALGCAPFLASSAKLHHLPNLLPQFD